MKTFTAISLSIVGPRVTTQQNVYRPTECTGVANLAPLRVLEPDVRPSDTLETTVEIRAWEPTR